MRGAALALTRVAIGVAMLGAAVAAGQELPAHDAVPADELVGPGYWREYVVQRQPLSEEHRARIIAAGKPLELDPASGDVIVRTFVDHLPQGWLLEQPADGA